jgi:hypothetical protein
VYDLVDSGSSGRLGWGVPHDGRAWMLHITKRACERPSLYGQFLY